MIEHVTCKVCGQILNNYKCLGHHIKRDHQLTSVQYYEQYVEQSNDNYKCPFCNNKRKFKNINEGFRKTCGSACCEQQQTKATNIQKYGCSNVFQSDAIKQRIYATKEQRYNNPKYVNVKKHGKPGYRKIMVNGMQMTIMINVVQHVLSIMVQFIILMAEKYHRQSKHGLTSRRK